MAYNSLRKKVALGLVRLMDKLKESKNGKSIINISRDDLSHVVGSSLESTIRTLKEFKTEKLIQVEDNGAIVILDEQKIRNLKH
jgi:CRP-like cAMP-binding protein